jgi:NAD(P)-dependent dehydrogenase (short-subunit alcohol dehydrogenase family)
MSKDTRVALITGGSGYVGSAITAALLLSGWRVVNISRNGTPVDGADTVVCDITNEAQVNQMLHDLVRTYGAFDACIHTAAAPIARTAVLESSLVQFHAQFEVSVTGAFLFFRAAQAYMNKGAAFIAVTTRSIERDEKTERRIGAYLASKEALRALLRSLSVELNHEDIRVYAVAPGFMPGGLNNDLPPGVQAILGRQKDGTPGSAHQVGEVVAQLCTNTDSTAFPPGVSVALPSLRVTPL